MKRPTRASRVDPAAQAFRQWTRGVSFTLTLGKSQVAALVCLHASIAQPKQVAQGILSLVGLYHKALRHFVVAAEGLQERGLVAYTKPQGQGWVKPAQTWRITAPGEAVVKLLQIAGVYQELLEEYLESDREHGRRRLKVI